MNYKKFIIGGIIGGITDWLLGWLFYGILFKDTFSNSSEEMNLLFITLGCLSFGFFISYIFSKWTNYSTLKQGIMAAILISILLSLYSNFFHYHSFDKLFFLDFGIGIVMGTIVGGVIAAVHGKIK